MTNLRRQIFIVLLIGSISFEALCAFIIVKWYPNYNYAVQIQLISIHFVSALLAAWAVYFFSVGKRRVASFIFIIVLTLPVLGYISVFHILLIHKKVHINELLKKYRAQIITSGKNTIISPQFGQPFEYLRRRIELEPVQDAVVEADYFKKLEIIRNMGQIPGKGSIKILKNFLKDPHMDVRYYAGEEIAKITEWFNVFINDLKEDIRNSPESHEIHLELGSLLIEYINSGLLEDFEIKEELEDVKKVLNKSLTLKGNQFRTNLLLGRLHQDSGEYDTAIRHYSMALSYKEDDAMAVLGLTECFWRKKDFSKMNNCIERINKHREDYKGEYDVRIKELIEIWREGNDTGLSE